MCGRGDTSGMLDVPTTLLAEADPNSLLLAKCSTAYRFVLRQDEDDWEGMGNRLIERFTMPLQFDLLLRRSLYPAVELKTVPCDAVYHSKVMLNTCITASMLTVRISISSYNRGVEGPQPGIGANGGQDLGSLRETLHAISYLRQCLDDPFLVVFPPFFLPDVFGGVFLVSSLVVSMKGDAARRQGLETVAGVYLQLKTNAYVEVGINKVFDDAGYAFSKRSHTGIGTFIKGVYDDVNWVLGNWEHVR
ncbi:hypothetical protein EDB83DRAFT_2633278 [Lactarius deliciosus]|nr:hypothetical protein EDB83DRAFT_2633278 [Lactarius deliciosus]